MDWPRFDEYDPDAKKSNKPKAPRNQAPGEIYRLNKDGEMTKDGGEISVTTMGSAGNWSDEDDEGVPVK